jgi:hypothetical protein
MMIIVTLCCWVGDEEYVFLNSRGTCPVPQASTPIVINVTSQIFSENQMALTPKPQDGPIWSAFGVFLSFSDV